MALQRFTSRRGNPRQICSDNRQKSVSANHELKLLLLKLDQNVIIDKLSMRKIQWHFIPTTEHGRVARDSRKLKFQNVAKICNQ